MAGEWRLQANVLTTRVLLWIAGAGRSGEPTPEVHLYLADRYLRLAALTAVRDPRASARFQATAEEHLAAAGVDPTPPAVAVAMPTPRRPTFTNAVSRSLTNRPSDDDAA